MQTDEMRASAAAVRGAMLNALLVKSRLIVVVVVVDADDEEAARHSQRQTQ